MITALLLTGITFFLGLKLPSRARLAYFICISAHLCVAILNTALGGQLIGANADAQRFFRYAVERSSVFYHYTWDLSYLVNGTNGFLNIHSLVQRFCGPSFFLAHTVTLFGVSICLVFLADFWLRCGGKKEWLSKILVYYSCVPAILLFHSYILREVWQAACIFGVASSVVRLQQDGMKPGTLVQLIFFLVLGSLTHNAMPIMLLAEVIAMFFAYSLVEKKRTSVVKNTLIVVGVLSFLGIIVASSTFLSQGDGEGLQNKAEQYANRLMENDARTDYGAHFEASRPWTLFLAFFAYQFEPMPWRVSSASDLIAFMESWIRLYMLYLFWRSRKKARSYAAANATASLCAWLAIEIIWSVGTVNWGTAMRHHTAAYGLLLVGAMVMKQEYERVARQMRPKTLKTETGLAA